MRKALKTGRERGDGHGFGTFKKKASLARKSAGGGECVTSDSTEIMDIG